MRTSKSISTDSTRIKPMFLTYLRYSIQFILSMSKIDCVRDESKIMKSEKKGEHTVSVIES